MLGPYVKAEAQKTLLYSSGIMIYFIQTERVAGFAKLRHSRIEGGDTIWDSVESPQPLFSLSSNYSCATLQKSRSSVQHPDALAVVEMHSFLTTTCSCRLTKRGKA